MNFNYLTTLIEVVSQVRTEAYLEPSLSYTISFFTRILFLRNYFCKKAPSQMIGLRSATLLKKRLRHRCFPVNFAKFLRTPLFTEHFQRLLLDSVFYCHEHKTDESYIKIAGFFCNANFISDVSQFTQQNLSFCQQQQAK